MSKINVRPFSSTVMHDFSVTHTHTHTNWHTRVHWTCVHLAELVIGACAPLTCFLHAHLSQMRITAPCHPDISCFCPLRVSTHAAFTAVVRNKSAGSRAPVKDPIKTQQYRPPRKEAVLHRSCWYMTCARGHMENISKSRAYEDVFPFLITYDIV